MYNEYFGFKESPFSIAPDPRYLYMTAQHREALAHLVYGLNSEGGCILLTGEVGTGKTTICRCLLEQIPDHANVALVLNPKVNEIELLETICDELKISYPDANNSLKTYTDRIYDFLLRSNRNDEKTVLIIDEAQNLDSKVLEQLRLLTNLETDKRKLLQIIILGQPELLEILARSEMRQLAQRITARFHLQPLTRFEVKAYVSHRLAVSGQSIQLFPEKSIKLLYRLSNGIPRLINIICDRALLGAYVENQYAVNPSTIKKAATEVFGELKNVEKHQKNKRWLYPLAAIASTVFIALAILFYFNNNNENTNDNSPLLSASTQSQKEQAPAIEITNTKNINTTPEEKNKSENILHATSTTGVATTTALETSETNNKQQPVTEIDYNNIEDIISREKNNPVSAYQELFNIWNQKYNVKTNANACKQANAYSLSCLHKQGNLNNLKAHNRPAVLSLVNQHGETRLVTIVAINNDFATIYSNNTSYTVKLNELDRVWYGKFILLWHKPEHYRTAITPGDSGDIVNWLSQQLTKINKNLSELITHTYGEHLVDKVVAFQEKQGLTADGIVGPVTIIHLNTQSGMDAPTLINVNVPVPQLQATQQG